MCEWLSPPAKTRKRRGRASQMPSGGPQMAQNRRSSPNKGQSRKNFKSRANKTHGINMARPLRGGIRL